MFGEVEHLTSEEFRTDPLFLRNQFKWQGTFEIPLIKREKIKLEDVELIGYDKLNENDTEKIVHFFLDDYKFESVWKDPERHCDRLKKYRAVLSPQFSLYTEMPLALQIYNIFRNRWCGAFLQSKGVKVIPSLSWGAPATFWFCFDGVDKGSVVAVSTVGVRREKDLFMQGYRELLKRIEPSAILCYGEPFEEMVGNVIAIDYAKTNHLSKWVKATGHPAKEKRVESDTVCLLKGLGRAGGGGATSLPLRSKPNSRQSLYKNGKLEQERYYDENGRATEDVDYSDHGNPKRHPQVPHKHKWDWSNPDSPRRLP